MAVIWPRPNLGLLLAGIALLAGCSDGNYAAGHPELLQQARLVVPTHLTPPVFVKPLDGAPEQWGMNRRVAAALQAREIPASAEVAGRSSYTLAGRARPAGPEGSGSQMSLTWELFDPDGNKVGDVTQLAAVPDESWLKADAATVDAVAEAAAESISPVVPSASLSDQQFDSTGEPVPQGRPGRTQSAAQRRANEKGAGPLQKRFARLSEVGGDEGRRLNRDYTAREAPEIALEADPKRVLASPPATTSDFRPVQTADGSGGITELPLQPARNPAAAAEPAPSLAKSANPEAATGTAPKPAPPSEPKSAVPVTVYWVQVGAFREPQVAKTWFAGLKRKNPDILGSVPHITTPVDLGGAKGVMYRVRVGPFPSEAAAGRMCRELKAVKIDCFIWKAG